MEVGRRPGVEGGGTSCSAVMSLVGRRRNVFRVSRVCTSLSQLGSISRLRLYSVSRHRGQRLFLEVWGGCQTTKSEWWISGESAAPEGGSPSNRLVTTGVISHCPEFSIKSRYSKERRFFVDGLCSWSNLAEK
jgi:hypothetical protein